VQYLNKYFDLLIPSMLRLVRRHRHGEKNVFSLQKRIGLLFLQWRQQRKESKESKDRQRRQSWYPLVEGRVGRDQSSLYGKARESLGN
jgi:hypothetical protein